MPLIVDDHNDIFGSIFTGRATHVDNKCAIELTASTRAHWDAPTRTVTCDACVDGPTTMPAEANAAPRAIAVPPPPLAGASAQREYDRRAKRREDHVRAAHPKLVGLLLALFDEPTSTRVWAQGANGERAMGAKLDELEGQHVATLHDRSMLRPDGRRSRANIDHIAVAASGVSDGDWIDSFSFGAKRFRHPSAVNSKQ
jgi:hypothetical protein